MEDRTERTIGHLFGLVGGLLVMLGGLVAAVFGIADAVLGRTLGAATGLAEAVVLLVVGALILLFTQFGVHGWRDRPLASGVLLVVLAVVSWGLLGLGSNLLALVGGLFALLAGVLYLIEPTERAASALVAHA
jgi:hypothetical protein